MVAFYYEVTYLIQLTVEPCKFGNENISLVCTVADPEIFVCRGEHLREFVLKRKCNFTR
jgi:hypothetical protein